MTPRVPKHGRSSKVRSDVLFQTFLKGASQNFSLDFGCLVLSLLSYPNLRDIFPQEYCSFHSLMSHLDKTRLGHISSDKVEFVLWFWLSSFSSHQQSRGWGVVSSKAANVVLRPYILQPSSDWQRCSKSLRQRDTGRIKKNLPGAWAGGEQEEGGKGRHS